MLAAALIAPGSAAADACLTSGPLIRTERASGPIKVVPGRSIGPIAAGMTKRAISRATGTSRPEKHFGSYEFRVRGLTVSVSFGRWGFARALYAESAKLVVNRVRLSAGPDAVAAALPGIERVDCGAGYTELYLQTGERRTAVFLPPAPAIPRLTIVNAAVTR